MSTIEMKRADATPEEPTEEKSINLVEASNLVDRVEEYKPDKVTNDYIMRMTPSGRDFSSLRYAHSQGYFELGYVSRDHENSNGFLDREVDPYTERSVYYATFTEGSGVQELPFTTQDGEKIYAVARKIIPPKNASWEWFQMYQHGEIDEKGKKILESIDPSSAVEISGLVKWRPEDTIHTFSIYSEMFRDSMEKGEAHWLMTLVNQSKTRLTELLAPALTQLGPEKELSNTNVTTTPFMIEIKQGLMAIAASVIRIESQLEEGSIKDEKEKQKMEKLAEERRVLVSVIASNTPEELLNN